jgi:hypothetical protein
MAALLLAACGGGGDGAPVESPLQAEDRRASASIGGLIGFAQALIAQATSDTAEARPVDGITPPTSETDEPQPL